MNVPADALWGASTQRAVLNFPIAGRPIPAPLIHALGLVKSACAKVNLDLGLLSPPRAAAIIDAAEEVAAGTLDAHFVVDLYQTGSGTSSNMNANEVIANRASQRAGRPIGSRDPVHPNDHVNLGQSSNDVFPTAMHVAAAGEMRERLRPALQRLHGSLEGHARRWAEVIKIGRTHLMDATPVFAGQVFSGYAHQAALGLKRLDRAIEALAPLAIGGTAVGTGLNTHEEFGRRVAAEFARRTGLPYVEAANHFEAQAAKDACVEASGQLKVIAVSLSKIASDLRLMGSGPRCGLGELLLPAIQPGSSIMPGKVNPVICESVMQVAVRVIGHDAAVTAAAMGGVGSILELNVAMPVIADALLESIHLLARAAHVLVDNLLAGLEVDARRCGELVERSLMLVTRLVPALGYDQAAAIAKEGLDSGRSLREILLARATLPPSEIDRLLDPRAMTQPGGEAQAGG